MKTTSTDKTAESETKVKTVPGLKGSVAMFIRPRDNKRIDVFPRRNESVEDAIRRVKAHNGATGVVHSLVQN
jgi:hypothetical protein